MGTRTLQPGRGRGHRDPRGPTGLRRLARPGAGVRPPAATRALEAVAIGIAGPPFRPAADLAGEPADGRRGRDRALASTRAPEPPRRRLDRWEPLDERDAPNGARARGRADQRHAARRGVRLLHRAASLTPRPAGRRPDGRLSLPHTWGGGTSIGASLRAFLRHGERHVTRETLVLIVSDGLDVGEPEVLRNAMREFRRRSAGVSGSIHFSTRRATSRPPAAWRSTSVHHDVLQRFRRRVVHAAVASGARTGVMNNE